MNAYLKGTYALASVMPPAPPKTPQMTTAEARALIAKCVIALNSGCERGDARSCALAEQLMNMADVIDRRGGELLPCAAAAVLERAAAEALGNDQASAPAPEPPSEEPAGDGGADDESETEPLISDFGWVERPETEVFDADGSFDTGDADGSYEVLGARTTLGPRGRNRSSVVGVAVLEWDNHHTYQPGEVVYFGQRHWRAMREVTPPFMPAFMKGDEPGSSSAWSEISAADVYAGNVVGDMIGMEDITARKRQMNNLKPVTVGIAKILVKYGQQAIAKAIEGAKQPWYRADLPGDTARNTALWKLRWHADTLAKAGADQNATYAPGDDLKDWVMQAFIEQNAVEEGNAAAAQMWTLAWSDWSSMWSEIAVALAALPKKLLQTLATLPGKAFEAATGVPSWAFYVGAVALTGLVGYGAYKILAGPAGGAVVGHYLGRR